MSTNLRTGRLSDDSLQLRYTHGLLLAAIETRCDADSQQILVGFGLLASLAATLPASAGSGRRVAPQDRAIRFVSDLNQALEGAKARNLPLFLAFGAVWCPVCRVMESTTLLETSVQASPPTSCGSK